MSSCGGYPLGAEHDPRAPWNQPDPVEVECPDCAGTGYAEEPFAVEVGTGRETPVTHIAWMCLPASEAEALARGQRWFRAPREECDTCGGSGRVEVDPRDIEDDGFDELAAEEKYYERKYGGN